MRTVTLRLPVDALDEIEMLTVRCVESVRVTELTVIPEPENHTELFVQVPDPKFEPVMTMFWFTAPWPRELGLSEEMDGAAAIVRQLLHVAIPPGPGLLTVTLRLESVAPLEIVTVAFSSVELTNVTEFTVSPLPEMLTVAPDTKPVPLMAITAFVAPRPIVFGLTLVTLTIAEAATVKICCTWGAAL